VTKQQSDKRPRRRWWAWIGLSAAAIGVAIPVAVHVLTPDYPIERLKSQIRSEIPVGSTREQVDAWAVRRLGRHAGVNAQPWPAVLKGQTMPEAAGVPWDDVGSMMDVTVPAVGWYTVNGQTARNELMVFITLDAAGRVKGHHFLTLEELAGIERRRREGATP
jgi:hypothetical protein